MFLKNYTFEISNKNRFFENSRPPSPLKFQSHILITSESWFCKKFVQVLSNLGIKIQWINVLTLLNSKKKKLSVLGWFVIWKSLISNFVFYDFLMRYSIQCIGCDIICIMFNILTYIMYIYHVQCITLSN